MYHKQAVQDRDDADDLEYGPGFVSKLRNRYTLLETKPSIEPITNGVGISSPKFHSNKSLSRPQSPILCKQRASPERESTPFHAVASIGATEANPISGSKTTSTRAISPILVSKTSTLLTESPNCSTLCGDRTLTSTHTSTSTRVNEESFIANTKQNSQVEVISSTLIPVISILEPDCRIQTLKNKDSSVTDAEQNSQIEVISSSISRPLSKSLSDIPSTFPVPYLLSRAFSISTSTTKIETQSPLFVEERSQNDIADNHPITTPRRRKKEFKLHSSFYLNIDGFTETARADHTPDSIDTDVVDIPKEDSTVSDNETLNSMFNIILSHMSVV